MRQLLFSIWEVLEIVLIAAVTVFLIRAFVVQPFLVSGASMELTFIDGDYVLVDEITYRFKEPERGDVVVFRYPLNPRLFYIKRIVGLPGDWVVVRGGDVFVGGQKLEEDYLKDLGTIGRVDVNVAEGELFVMGDNRYHSYDSRNFGVVPEDSVIGVVRLRLLPTTRAELIERPAY